MSRLARLFTLLTIIMPLLLLSSSIIHCEDVDDEALKKHVYSLNKPNLTSKRWLDRAGAAERIGALKIKEYAKEIAPLMKDPHPIVRLSAIRGIGMCGEPQHIDTLVDMIVSLTTTNQDRLFAVNCGWAIGQIDQIWVPRH